MRKSFLPVLLIAVLLLGACSSVQAPAAPTVAPTLAPTPAPTPEPTPDPTGWITWERTWARRRKRGA